jgi:hypothetical protein
MAFEAFLLVTGTFLVLAIGFWMAAHRAERADRESHVSRGSELHKV